MSVMLKKEQESFLLPILGAPLKELVLKNVLPSPSVLLVWLSTVDLRRTGIKNEPDPAVLRKVCTAVNLRARFIRACRIRRASIVDFLARSVKCEKMGRK